MWNTCWIWYVYINMCMYIHLKLELELLPIPHLQVSKYCSAWGLYYLWAVVKWNIKRNKKKKSCLHRNIIIRHNLQVYLFYITKIWNYILSIRILPMKNNKKLCKVPWISTEYFFVSLSYLFLLSIFLRYMSIEC